jgi:predicted component of type VI protein secretion system
MMSIVCIPFIYAKFGMYVASLEGEKATPKAPKAVFIEVSGNADAETLRQAFLSAAKIGPPSRIRQLVNLQIPGYQLDFLCDIPAGIEKVESSAFGRIVDDAIHADLQVEKKVVVHYGRPVDEWKMKLRLWALFE